MRHGTTTGILLLPAGYTESSAMQTLSLVGSYTYDPAAGSVTFDHESDSFLPYMRWYVTGRALRATFTAADDRLKATLERKS